MRRLGFCCLGYCFFAALAIAQSSRGQDVAATDTPPAPRAGTAVLSEAAMRSHIRFLADDLLEGRGPGSRGDALAQLYIATELESLGIQAGAADGSWNQAVPLVGISTRVPSSIHFRGPDGQLSLDHYRDMMVVSGRPEPKVSVEDAELVFVGYGIQAPEYDWDDYKGVDLRGKIMVVLNNDPQDDPQLFAGRRRLYYGRWDYKYEMAARLGAAGALIIHTTPSAGYPFQVVQTSWSGEEFELASTSGPRTNVKGWLTEESARRLAKLAGQDLDSLRMSAESRDFQPVPLGINVSLNLNCQIREQQTGNVLGVLPGSDPQLRDEYVVFTAHHDHLGLAAERDENGDNIYNGAIDNASGTATLLTIARAIAGQSVPPKRSVLFAFVAAEEQGLLGSQHLALQPPIPAGFMAAVINIDGINFLGKTHDVNVIGNGKSDLDVIVESVADDQGRVVVPDLSPDKGYYYRSDQFSLAKVGVPGVYLHSGMQVVGKPDGWGKQQIDAWIEENYHQPSDEYDANWNLAGALQDAELLMQVGLRVANQRKLPAWYPGDEFEAARRTALENRNR